ALRRESAWPPANQNVLSTLVIEDDFPIAIYVAEARVRDGIRQKFGGEQTLRIPGRNLIVREVHEVPHPIAYLAQPERWGEEGTVCHERRRMQAAVEKDLSVLRSDLEAVHDVVDFAFLKSRKDSCKRIHARSVFSLARIRILWIDLDQLLSIQAE